MPLVLSPRGFIGVPSSIASLVASTTAATTMAGMPTMPTVSAMPVPEHVHGNEQDE